MTNSRSRIIGGLLVLVVVFGLGLALGAYGLGNAGQQPCSEVTQDLEGAQDTLSETFGSGPEGRAAVAEIRAAIEERPDCFSPEARNFPPASSGVDSGTDAATETISEP